MRRDRVALLRLVSELESDIRMLDELFETNRLMTGKIELAEPEPGRTAGVNASVPQTVAAFRTAHAAYVTLLRDLAARLEEP